MLATSFVYACCFLFAVNLVVRLCAALRFARYIMLRHVIAYVNLIYLGYVLYAFRINSDECVLVVIIVCTLIFPIILLHFPM